MCVCVNTGNLIIHCRSKISLSKVKVIIFLLLFDKKKRRNICFANLTCPNNWFTWLNATFKTLPYLFVSLKNVFFSLFPVIFWKKKSYSFFLSLHFSKLNVNFKLLKRFIFSKFILSKVEKLNKYILTCSIIETKINSKTIQYSTFNKLLFVYFFSLNPFGYKRKKENITIIITIIINTVTRTAAKNK